MGWELIEVMPGGGLGPAESAIAVPTPTQIPASVSVATLSASLDLITAPPFMAMGHPSGRSRRSRAESSQPPASTTAAAEDSAGRCGDQVRPTSLVGDV